MAALPIFLAGKSGYVLQNGVARAFGKWSVPMHTKAVPVPSFLGQGYEQYVPGLTGAKVSISGAYSPGAMPFVAGAFYTFVLGFTANLFLTVYGMVESLEPDNDVEGTPMLKLSVQSSGPFSAFVQ